MSAPGNGEGANPVLPVTPIFEAERLSVSTPNAARPLLSEISLRLMPGEVLAVLGRHGAGGETLRDLLLEILPPRAQLTGSFARGMSGNENRLRLVYLTGPAQHALSPHLPVVRQFARVLARRQNIPLSNAAEELRLALQRLPGAPGLERLELLPSQLPPREQALAFLALALAQAPDAIVADDPAAGLDPLEAEELLRFLLAERTRNGFALLYFTGDPATAARLGGRIAVLRDGRLIEEGSAGRLSSSHAHHYTQSLFHAVPRLREPDELVRTGPRSEPLLQVRGFAFEKPKKGRFDPAKGITFDLRRAASLALIGEHDSGRRELTRAVVGLNPVPQGRIVFDSVDIGILSATMRARLRKRVAFISGDDGVLDPRMTVFETIMEPMRIRVNLGTIENRRAADAVLKRVGMGDVPPRRLTADLDALDRRRLQVARALAAPPQLLVLYEPLARLDAPGQALILDLLKELREREGAAILLVTADFAVAQALCENALVMRNKCVIEAGLVADLIRKPREAYTKAMVAAVSLFRPASPAALSPPRSEG